MRYAGIKNNRVCVVSDKPISSIQNIEIPPEFSNIESKDLINCRVKNNQIIFKFPNKKISEMKIAMVSNYGTKCGIGTYSKFLYDKIIDHVGDYRLFIEKNDVFDMDGSRIPVQKIFPCWKRGESPKELIAAIKEYNPDVVWIQHEFGLWPNARYWISLMNQLSEYRIIVTMHSVFHHKDKTIVEASIPEIVVHLPGAVDVLKKEKQISGIVHMIPHGCFPCTDKTKLWNFYKSEHTFIQFGFLFKYKGWENSLETVSLLKDKYPDIFFTGLLSEAINNKSTHDVYYAELMDLVEKLQISENVGLIRGYQSENTLDAYLRTNKISLFPYVSSPEHEVYGASGAARMAMSKGLPVITSNVNHFQDLPTIKANSPQDMAKALDLLFSNKKKYDDQINKQNIYLEQNSWEKIAQLYINLFETKIDAK